MRVARSELDLPGQKKRDSSTLLRFIPLLSQPPRRRMIPATRRVAPGSLTVVRNVQGRQVARNTFGALAGGGGKNLVVVQHGTGRSLLTRSFSHTSTSRSSLNFVLQPKERGDTINCEARNEESPGRPEHAVISTFDLFSIGGPYPNPSLSPRVQAPMLVTSLPFSRSEQFAHRRPYAGWQHIYQRSEGFGYSGAGACCLAAVKHG